MSGFSIGGIGAGLTKGLAYDVQFNRSLVWAVKTRNVDALAALADIAAANAKEILGTAAEVGTAQAVALLLNPDPFQGSRQLMHGFESKYGKK